MQLYPIQVPGYLIPFISNEMDGIKVVLKKEEYTTIKINPKSTLGMFLTKRLRPNYKVKFYQLSLYSIKTGDKRAFSAELLEIHNSSEFRADLSFEELESFYKFLEANFRMSFYFFVKGYCLSNSNSKISNAISSFCDAYELLEYGYSEKMLRNLYNKLQHKGAAYKLHNNERLSSLSF